MRQNNDETEKNGGCGHADKSGIQKLPENELSHIRNVIAVVSGKGGVGKSSITSILACEYRKKGYSVGVLDADITGPSLPKMFGIKSGVKSNGSALLPSISDNRIRVMSLNLLTSNEDDPVIWRGPVISGTVKQFWTDVAWGDLDYLFVDLPPGTGDVPLTVMQSLPLNGLIVVSSPQDLAVMIVSKAIKMAQHMNIPILGLVENMSSAVCPHCGERFELFGPSRGKEIAEKFKIPFIGGLPIDPHLSKLCDQGKIEEYDSNLFENLIPEKLVQ
ncbi:Mrp/NBP35 family ATP-binding protein [Pelotomaculum terephthalicicum JT]|uniref:Mrp/NBP35 family ATP-binding protein n=1 Tax=Pelotomaculum TaxID=191373 RepID=UPI0009C7AF2A|nr:MULTISPECIES: Mrp/NBP35 family ATP-binding protein [Pelotomaculum]MCG9966807.1 Mrp/NBP35 family ATP-binding protein [Pelotomaculum terephthalicicum JT]OPX91588.1 MAG: antiporter inner membrane protein [Pelotomaculum sp. PtaB.Bin117]OPY62313.1 MAG: antiporter inner membrane protein [Pelotomaculum sp. PtaU1.Bin065]